MKDSGVAVGNRDIVVTDPLAIKVDERLTGGELNRLYHLADPSCGKPSCAAS